MKCFLRRLFFMLLAAATFSTGVFAQQALTWQQVQDRFATANPFLLAGQVGIEEARAQEITAYLRPNPSLGLTADQLNPFPGGPSHSTFGDVLSVATVSYLHERRRKRELRLESAQDNTKITTSGQADLTRNLLFTLRGAFVQILHEKAVLALAKEILAYYDHLLDVNRDRYKAGAIAQVDLDRLEIQRVQYESDLQTAEVNLRTAKIQLLQLLNDRTPVKQFDVSGPYDFSADVQDLATLRQIALDTRPDLLAAIQTTEKARNDYQLAVANGSTDPTFSFDAGRNPPIDQYIGVGVTIPLRIFDHNQGEKLRTKLDIQRSERLTEATRAQVFNDVDSAHATLMSTVILLKPYKEHYLPQASRIRDTISFSYEHGAASLLDFLSAQADYRSVQLSYLNLISSYLVAASQLNLAVGREVIP
ncbi:MAG: outer membrane protein heavy metal efflux system [Acidobacteriaceae bacterium]|jgi:cobalt-zinc-cadmium efflux system outer membrane protein|nr:outer membrane protein heavy metal efflux system [Acidobacteriaceae bacterium]